MALLADLLDLFETDTDTRERVIKAGTLRTTRGTAVVLVVLLTLLFVINGYITDIPFMEQGNNKFSLVVVGGFIWAFTSASDNLSRGIASARTEAAKISVAAVHPLPAQLECTRTEGNDDPGWRAVAFRKSMSDDLPEFLVLKGAQTVWVKVKDLKF